MSKLSEIKVYSQQISNVLNKSTLLLSNRALQRPIYDLLKSMDSDKNMKLTSDELYNGLLDNCSSGIFVAENVVGGIKNLLTPKNKSITGELEARTDRDENLDILFSMFGSSSSSIKAQVGEITGEEGIDISNFRDTLSNFAGTDINVLLAEAKRYGLDIDINTVSLEDLKDLADRADKIFDVLIRFDTVKNDLKKFKLGHVFSKAPDLIKDVYELYKTEPIVNKYLNKQMQNLLSTLLIGFYDLKPPIEKHYEESLIKSGNARACANYALARYAGGGL